MPLDTISYNFELAGGGGGATATLNGVPVEIFCDDFANEINVPSDNSADVTDARNRRELERHQIRRRVLHQLGPPISLSDGNTTLDNLDDTFFNSWKRVQRPGAL